MKDKNIKKTREYKYDENNEWDKKVKLPIINAFRKLNIKLSAVQAVYMTDEEFQKWNSDEYDDKANDEENRSTGDCTAIDSFYGKQNLDIRRFVTAVKEVAKYLQNDKKQSVEISEDEINRICDELEKELIEQSTYLWDRSYCVTEEKLKKISEDSSKYWIEGINKKIEGEILGFEEYQKAVLYNNIDTFLKFCIRTKSFEESEVNVYTYYFDFLYLCYLVANHLKKEVEEYFENISFNSSIFWGNHIEHEMIFEHARKVVGYFGKIGSEESTLGNEIDNVALFKKIKNKLRHSNDKQDRSSGLSRYNGFATKISIITLFEEWEWKMLLCFSLIGMANDRHKKFLEVINFIGALVDVKESTKYFEKEKAKSIINGLRILTDYFYKEKDRKQHIERLRAYFYLYLEHYSVESIFY